MKKYIFLTLLLIQSQLAFSITGSLVPNDYSKNNLENSIVIVSRIEGRHFETCTGLLIGIRHVLTAKHCLTYSTDPGTSFLTPGSYTLSEEGRANTSKTLKVFFPRSESSFSQTSTWGTTSKNVKTFEVPALNDIHFPEKIAREQALFNTLQAPSFDMSDIVILELESDAPRNFIPYDVKGLTRLTEIPDGPMVAFGINSIALEANKNNQGLQGIVRAQTRSIRLGTDKESEDLLRRQMSTIETSNEISTQDKEATKKYLPFFKSIFGSFADSLNFVTKTTDGTMVCSGDSGGPLFIKHNGSYVLIGVTHAALNESKIFRGSAVISCGSTQYYGNINSVLEWIQRVVN